MNPYYDQLLAQYTNSLYQPQQPQQLQKTPEELLNDLKQQKYPEFCSTSEGIKATQDYQSIFDQWYNAKYNSSGHNATKEIAELKEMMATLAQQNQTLMQQFQSMNKPTNNHQNNNNSNSK